MSLFADKCFNCKQFINYPGHYVRQAIPGKLQLSRGKNSRYVLKLLPKPSSQIKPVPPKLKLESDLDLKPPPELKLESDLDLEPPPELD